MIARLYSDSSALAVKGSPLLEVAKLLRRRALPFSLKPDSVSL